MNLGLSTRSALVRAAEQTHNGKPRPAYSSQIVMAERRERSKSAIQQILAVCVAGMVVVMMAVLIGQVMP